MMVGAGVAVVLSWLGASFARSAECALEPVESAPPVAADHPLLFVPNTILTPHVGARTHAALARMNAVVEDVIRVLKGEVPRHPAWREGAGAGRPRA